MPGDSVPWTSHLRADVPGYIMEQLREAAYRMRCTVVALILRALAAYVDADGNAVFCIRDEDLVADRRKSWRR
jgi:hypothetical protein